MLAALDIVDNIVPFIPKNEEEKVERETQKILGVLQGERIEPCPVRVSATCTRVPVLDGHTEAVTVALSRETSMEEAGAAMREFGGDLNPQTHPSAPARWITLHDDPFRPQPRRDREADGGMTTSVGRLRPDHVLGPHGLKFVLVSHNTKMGAGQRRDPGGRGSQKPRPDHLTRRPTRASRRRGRRGCVARRATAPR